jgi:hypothetical protein
VSSAPLLELNWATPSSPPPPTPPAATYEPLAPGVTATADANELSTSVLGTDAVPAEPKLPSGVPTASSRVTPM